MQKNIKITIGKYNRNANELNNIELKLSVLGTVNTCNANT